MFDFFNLFLTWSDFKNKIAAAAKIFKTPEFYFFLFLFLIFFSILLLYRKNKKYWVKQNLIACKEDLLELKRDFHHFLEDKNLQDFNFGDVKLQIANLNTKLPEAELYENFKQKKLVFYELIKKERSFANYKEYVENKLSIIEKYQIKLFMNPEDLVKALQILIHDIRQLMNSVNVHVDEMVELFEGYEKIMSACIKINTHVDSHEAVPTEKT